jgi:uncharacterized membrane protein YphA (DoxX/SURF4 family)
VTLRSTFQQIEQFFFYRESDRWVSVLRIGLGLQVICLSLALRKDWTYLLSSGGRALISRDLTEAALNAESSFIPRLGWLIEVGNQFRVPESITLWFTWLVLMLAGSLLLVGLFSRIAAILAWFLYLCVVRSVGYFSYGVDNLTIIGLFYLMIAPLGDRMSLDSIFWHRSSNRDLLPFFRRILQIHLCLIYFFGGVSKLAGIGWWNGTSLWRALTVPPFQFVNPELLVRWKMFLPAAGLAICALELFYPIFIWFRPTRTFWLVSICAMHLMIGLTMGMFLFAFIMIVLNLAAFATFESFTRRLRARPVGAILQY